MKAVILNIGDPSHYSPSNNNAITMRMKNLVLKAVNVVPDIGDPPHYCRTKTDDCESESSCGEGCECRS